VAYCYLSSESNASPNTWTLATAGRAELVACFCCMVAATVHGARRTGMARWCAQLYVTSKYGCVSHVCTLPSSWSDMSCSHVAPGSVYCEIGLGWPGVVVSSPVICLRQRMHACCYVTSGPDICRQCVAKECCCGAGVPTGMSDWHRWLVCRGAGLRDTTGSRGCSLGRWLGCVQVYVVTR
jgi:hypothetical protein